MFTPGCFPLQAMGFPVRRDGLGQSIQMTARSLHPTSSPNSSSLSPDVRCAMTNAAWPAARGVTTPPMIPGRKFRDRYFSSRVPLADTGGGSPSPARPSTDTFPTQSRPAGRTLRLLRFRSPSCHSVPALRLGFRVRCRAHTHATRVQSIPGRVPPAPRFRRARGQIVPVAGCPGFANPNPCAILPCETAILSGICA